MCVCVWGGGGGGLTRSKRELLFCPKHAKQNVSLALSCQYIGAITAWLRDISRTRPFPMNLAKRHITDSGMIWASVPTLKRLQGS